MRNITGRNFSFFRERIKKFPKTETGSLFDEKREIQMRYICGAAERGISTPYTERVLPHLVLAGSPLHIKRLLTSLLGNAGKYGGGSVGLSAWALFAFLAESSCFHNDLQAWRQMVRYKTEERREVCWMADTVVVKPAIAAQFERFAERGRVLLFSAPCGFGKSALADKLLEGRRVLRCDAAASNFRLPQAGGKWEFLLLDNLQQLQEQADQQALCELIRECPERRFVLLSRGMPPGWLAAFGYAGLMTTLDAGALLFDREDTRRLLTAYDVQITESELTSIMQESIGYPLGVVITARCLMGGAPYGKQIIGQAYRELYAYFEAAVYHRFDLPLRRFLLELAPFEEFDLEMARVVSGDVRAGELLDWIQRNTTMLRYDDVERFHFWPQFRGFLIWEMEREYAPEKRRALFARGGLYYELHEDYSHALAYYTASGDHAKVSELLIRNAELHPGMGHYGEMEQYYRSLPEEEILASPALMQGMSMLSALGMDYAASERWYREMAAFAERHRREEAVYRQVRGRMAWLDISLPQREVENLTEKIPAVYRLLTNKAVVLPPFSVTSALPSLMNGGKDFSAWSKKDDLLYQTLRVPVEAVLGRDGVGLADCAMAESKFEKGEDISARMLSLVSKLGKIQLEGTPDMEFAVVGLLARSQLAGGRPEDARSTVQALRTRFETLGQSRFFANIDALLCRIALHTGDLDAAEAWYRNKAPRDVLNLNVMRRYQYFTQAMVELAGGRPEDALLTLVPLEQYCRVCARHIDGIQLALLRAIACYRMKDEYWREQLQGALQTAADYRFIRPVSQFGAALLPLLERVPPACGGKKWAQQLMNAVRAQAAIYPALLQPRLTASEALTATELQVLRLMCADKSNAEIGQILDIRMSTVKTHVSHIFDKLNVSRRSEAKTAARRLWLIE